VGRDILEDPVKIADDTEYPTLCHNYDPTVDEPTT